MTAPSELATALVKLQGQLPHIPKGEKGKVEGVTKQGKPFSYEYSYADLHGVSAAILPLMSDVGLAFTARPTINADGKFVLAYSLIHESGESIDGEYLLPDPERYKQQDIGGVITYARRYCLCAVTGVAPAEDDDDAQAASKTKPAKPAAPRGQRPPERPTAPVTRTPVTGEDHERLRYGTVEATPEDRPATRTRGPDDASPWQDVPPEERPGSADKKDITKIQMAYQQLGFARTDRAQLLNISRQITGRELTGPNPGTTHNNLSYAEAVKLRDTLESLGGDRGALMERLTGITQTVAAVDAQEAAEASQEGGSDD